MTAKIEESTLVSLKISSSMNHHMYFAMHLQAPNKLRKQNQDSQFLTMGETALTISLVRDHFYS